MKVKLSENKIKDSSGNDIIELVVGVNDIVFSKMFIPHGSSKEFIQSSKDSMGLTLKTYSKIWEESTEEAKKEMNKIFNK